MKHMQTVRRYGSKALVAAAAFGSSMAVMAADGIAAGAVTELSAAKGDANTVGIAIVGIVAAVAVIGIIIGLVRRGGK